MTDIPGPDSVAPPADDADFLIPDPAIVPEPADADEREIDEDPDPGFPDDERPTGFPDDAEGTPDAGFGAGAEGED